MESIYVLLVVAATVREPTRSDVAKLETKIKRLEIQLEVRDIIIIIPVCYAGLKHILLLLLNICQLKLYL